MFEAINTTTLSRRACALSRTAIASRKRRSNCLGAPTETGITNSPRRPAERRTTHCKKLQFSRQSRLAAVKTEQGMQGPHRKLGVGRIDQYADFDLGCRDRFDIDAFFGKRAEHLRGNPGVAPHADTYRRYLGDVGGAAQ